MTTQVKKQRIFDVKDYKNKIIKSLENLESSQQPGENSGSATKTIVLEAAKDSIKKLFDKKYTSKQIADAISKDVFSILPKSITQMMGTNKAIKKPALKTVKTTEKNKQTQEKQKTDKKIEATKQPSDSGTFKIKQDRTDL